MSNMMIQGLANSGATAGVGKANTGESADGGFGEVLKDALDSVSKSQNEANALVAGLASGDLATAQQAYRRALISMRP